MASKMIYVWTSVIFVLTDAQMFTSTVDSKSTKCLKSEYNLPWSFSVSPDNAATVQWKKDGTTMLTWVVTGSSYSYNQADGYNASKIIHNNNGNITIKTLTSGDAGVYFCEVLYVTGKIIKSTNVTLTISSCETTTDGLSVGEWVVIALCILIVVALVVGISYKVWHRNKAHQNPQNPSTPPPKVTIETLYYKCPKGYTVKLIVVVVSDTPVTNICWQKKVDDELVPIKLSANNSKYRGSSKHDPSLTICDVCSIDSGEYRCFATNISGKGESTRTATLSVIAKAQEYEAPVGSKVDLLESLCDIKNVTSVKWKHARKQNLNFEDVEDLTYKGGIDKHPSLTIRWVSLEDIGTWRCFLETETSKHVIDAQLKIKEKQMEATVGSKVKLIVHELCEINDIEKVEWYHNNEAPEKPSNSKENDGLSYIIEKAVCENSGTWLCILQMQNSKKSKKTYKIQLDVKDKGNSSFPPISGVTNM